MSEERETIRWLADEPYYHPRGGSWGVRRAQWGAVSLQAPLPADRVLSEFERCSCTFNGGGPIPVAVDNAGALGARLGHTSRVRWIAGGPSAGGKLLVVYVQERSRSFTYTVCHEVVHNLLYADGLSRLNTPPNATADDIALISQISTSTSHPLVAKRLEDFEWPVTPYEAERAERFLKALSRGAVSLSEPAAALIAAEFTVVLGRFWLQGAQPALRRVSPFTESLAIELLPYLEACCEGVVAVEECRRAITKRLLFGVELEGANPLLRVPGPGWTGLNGEPVDASRRAESESGLGHR